ncbi:MAG: zinc ribbon domain-containing protein [Oscillospiraceae bacterium]|nr:zinc ribbon domain-containing protein [Oscillospiraceae bacterium]
MKFCPWCGETLINGEAVFCEHCGKRIRPPASETPGAQPSKEPEKREDEPEAAALKPVSHLEFEEEPAEYIPSQAPPPAEETPPVIDVHYRDASGGERPRRVKKAAGKSFALPMLCVIAGVALAVGGACLWMAAASAPKRAAAQFVQAVENADTAYIREHLQPQNTYAVTDEGLGQMCRSLQQAQLIPALEGHLLALGDPAKEGYRADLGCFAMKESRGGLFREYEVAISPVPVKAAVGLQEVTLTVDGETAAYTANNDGDVPLRLLPGSHTVKAAYSGYGTEYPLGEESFEAFSTEGVTLWLNQSASTAVIELAGNETGLSVSLDGRTTGLKAQSGRVVVSPAFAGMSVALSCDEYTEEFLLGSGETQNFEVKWIYETEKKNPGPASLAPADITNRQLASVGSRQFYQFYLSYLEAINQWDPSRITGVSNLYSQELIEKMEAHNKDYLFDFKWMEIDKDTVDRWEEDGKTWAGFAAQVYYEYSYKDDTSMWYAGGNYQQVTLVYEEGSGRWEVAGTKVYDSMELGSHLIRYEAE